MLVQNYGFIIYHTNKYEKIFNYDEYTFYSTSQKHTRIISEASIYKFGLFAFLLQASTV